VHTLLKQVTCGSQQRAEPHPERPVAMQDVSVGTLRAGRRTHTRDLGIPWLCQAGWQHEAQAACR